MPISHLGRCQCIYRVCVDVFAHMSMSLLFLRVYGMPMLEVSEFANSLGQSHLREFLLTFISEIIEAVASWNKRIGKAMLKDAQQDLRKAPARSPARAFIAVFEHGGL